MTTAEAGPAKNALSAGLKGPSPILASGQLFTNGSGYSVTSFSGVSPGREGACRVKRVNTRFKALQDR